MPQDVGERLAQILRRVLRDFLNNMEVTMCEAINGILRANNEETNCNLEMECLECTMVENLHKICTSDEVCFQLEMEAEVRKCIDSDEMATYQCAIHEVLRSYHKEPEIVRELTEDELVQLLWFFCRRFCICFRQRATPEEITDPCKFYARYTRIVRSDQIDTESPQRTIIVLEACKFFEQYLKRIKDQYTDCGLRRAPVTEPTPPPTSPEGPREYITVAAGRRGGSSAKDPWEQSEVGSDGDDPSDYLPDDEPTEVPNEAESDSPPSGYLRPLVGGIFETTSPTSVQSAPNVSKRKPELRSVTELLLRRGVR